MKRIFNFFAVLPLIAAAVFASCEKNMTEEESLPSLADDEVTITILPPVQSADTRVSVSEDATSLKIDGWKQGDSVNLYKLKYNAAGEVISISDAAKFTCVDAGKGVFKGKLPDGVKEADSLNFVVTGTAYIYEGKLYMNSYKFVSDDINESILMEAFKDADGSFKMKVVGNILRVNNNLDRDIDFAYKVNININNQYYLYAQSVYYLMKGDGTNGGISVCFDNNYCYDFKFNKFTCKKNSSVYVQCFGFFSWGLASLQDGTGDESCSFVPMKTVPADIYGVLYTYDLDNDPLLLPGKFSVNANGKQVQFSKGNLYCSRPSAASLDWTWGFYNAQYKVNSLNGSAAQRTATADDTEIDLFCWSYDSASTTNPCANVTASEFTDWGSVADVPGNECGGQFWNTLSADEWTYLLTGRSCGTLARTTDARYAYAKVEGRCGMMIFPDEFTWPSAVTSVPNTYNTYSLDWNGVDYTAAQFAELQAEGVVFLPITGFRQTGNVIYLTQYGDYWSSTSASETQSPRGVGFGAEQMNICDNYDKNHGFAVRLTHAVSTK